MKKLQRLGLLGGTFDPVHKGHLAAAGKASNVLSLDAVWFMPAAIPPHKKCHKIGHAISAFEDRAAMLDCALKDHTDFIVSRLESELPKPNFTIDTLKQIRRQSGPGVILFFIIGVDAFVEIDTWKSFQDLPVYTNIVVLSRPAYHRDRVDTLIRQCYKDYQCNDYNNTWESKEKAGKIYFSEMEPVAVSSTVIRSLVAEGKSIKDLVPLQVAEYIEDHGLYLTHT